MCPLAHTLKPPAHNRSAHTTLPFFVPPLPRSAFPGTGSSLCGGSRATRSELTYRIGTKVTVELNALSVIPSAGAGSVLVQGSLWDCSGTTSTAHGPEFSCPCPLLQDQCHPMGPGKGSVGGTQLPSSFRFSGIGCLGSRACARAREGGRTIPQRVSGEQRR